MITQSPKEGIVNTTPYAMGWQPDLPDIRDFTIETPAVKGILDKSAPLKSYRSALPDDVDLRKWCSPIEDQEDIGSCTANAGVGLMEYYQRRVFGKHLDLSRLFLYKTTRNLLGWDGDTGAYLRTTMKAMVMLGVCPESHLPYNTFDFDEEPEAFHYALAQNFQSVKYFRLDVFGIQGQMLLDQIKWMLAAGLPSMFGFTVYDSISNDGWIPFPKEGDKVAGGHAIVAVGYDDQQGNGALLIRNSWGTNWGHDGYGWLPYEYVLRGLASDFWCMSQAEFVDSDLFR